MRSCLWLNCWVLFLTLNFFSAAQAEDVVRTLQEKAAQSRSASWGHWGPNPATYSSWTSHSNRLIPIYTFGIDLTNVAGKNSAYRDESRIRELYGFIPEETLNAEAEYFDQTDVYRLQLEAAKGRP